MIQQKKAHRDFSQNYFQPFQPQEICKNNLKNQSSHYQSKKSSSVIHLNDSSLSFHCSNKQPTQITTKVQKSKNKHPILQKPQNKLKSDIRNQKNKRKTSKSHNLNISSSVLVLPQQKQYEGKIDSRQKRKSLLKLQINQQIQKQFLFQNEEKKKVSKIQKASKNVQESKKGKQQSSKANNLSLKKQQKKDKSLQNERKKHLSCASIIEGNHKSKSKSKSKSKQKKTKKKQSFKFNKINLVNKQNQPKNKNFATESIEKQFKLMTKKLEKQFDLKAKKSIKTIKNTDNDVTVQMEKKKSKVSNKQNFEPTKKKSKFGISMNKFQQFIQPRILIKKQPLHAHRKFSEKIQSNIRPTQRQKSNEKSQSSDFYFLIKKNETPSSSRREFPVNKYVQPSIAIESRQKKRHSFQKASKPSRKKSFIDDKQLSRQQSPIKNRYTAIMEETKIENSLKMKTKKPSKKKNQGNTSCLQLMPENIAQKGHKRRSQSISGHQLIYKEERSQQRQDEKIFLKKMNQQKQKDKLIKQDFVKEKIIQISNRQQSERLFVAENRINSQQTFLQYPSQSFNHSLNIQEIRYYESISPSNQAQAHLLPSNQTVHVYDNQPVISSTNEPQIFGKYFKNRMKIVSQLKDQYPLLNKKQLQFLASICFIQRKWKQIIVARKIKDLISLKNTSELFVKNKSQPKPFFQYEQKSSSHMTSVAISKSEMRHLTTQSQNTQTQEFISQDTEQHLNEIMSKKQKKLKQEEGDKQKEGLKKDTEQIQQSIKGQKQQLLSIIPFKQEDIFPDLSYLKTKKQIQKRRLIQSLEEINKAFKRNEFSQEQYELKKKELQLKYKQSVKQIIQTKKTVKKGYLKYIQTLNTVNQSLTKEEKSLKSSRKNTPSKLLKRVSSQESVLGDIYRKIFKLDQLSSDNGSQLSGQTKRLNEQFLIRKTNLPQNIQRSLQLKKLSGLGKNFGPSQIDDFIYTERGKRKQRTEEQEQNMILLSTREPKSVQIQSLVEMNFQSDANIIFQVEDLNDERQQIAPQINVQKSGQNLFQLKKESKESYNITDSIKSQSFKAYNISQLLLTPDQLNSLGESPIQRLGQKEQHSPEQLMQLKKATNEQFLEDEKLLKDNSKVRLLGKEQLQKEFNGDEIDNIYFTLDQNHQEFNEQMPPYISPVSSTMTLNNGANVESKQYLKKFVQFLKNSDIFMTQIQNGLNSPQGFTAIAYLRFVREFQLPDDQYVQIIPNQAFIEWEESIMRKGLSQSQKENVKSPANLILQAEPWYQSSFNHFKGIQHRCLYELINSEIEAFRVYGEKGRPFPWEISYSCFDPPVIESRKVGQILDRCLQRCFGNVLSFSCGIILQNHPDILTEEDLQELHDRNEDAIIDMIEGELVLEKNAWYEIEEHLLQTNFQISELVWHEIISELTKDVVNLKRIQKS